MGEELLLHLLAHYKVYFALAGLAFPWLGRRFIERYRSKSRLPSVRGDELEDANRASEGGTFEFRFSLSWSRGKRND